MHCPAKMDFFPRFSSLCIRTYTYSINHLPRRFFKRAQLAIVSYSVLPQASDSKQHQKIQNTKTSFLDMKTLKVIFVCILMPFFVLGSESGRKISQNSFM